MGKVQLVQVRYCMSKVIGRISILAIIASIFLFFPTKSHAATGYVPLQMTALNRDISQLFMLTNTLGMQRPYAISHVQKVVQSAHDQYPELASKIKNKLDKLQRRAVGHAQLSLKLSDDLEHDVVIPNALGEQSSSYGHLFFSGQQQVNDWINVSYGLNATNSFEELQAYETYVSFGTDMVQVDVGNKQDWLSPFQSRAMLYSNNAKTTFSVGVKNPIPFAGLWDLQYNVFVKTMEQHERVVVGNEVKPGTPYVLATQLSFQPLDGTSIALTRTFQFGGRGQDISLEQVWGALTDAVGNDNNGLIPDCGEERVDQLACEFGNQRASISVKQYFGGFSIYGEFAGEDAASGSNLFLGDLAISAGLNLPSFDLFNHTYSMFYEITEHQSAWHRHHIYKEGYRVDGVSLGHWGTNYTYGIEGASGLSQTLFVGTQVGEYMFDLTYVNHRNKKSPNQSSLNFDYVIHHDLDFTLSHLAQANWVYNFGLQRSVYDEFSTRLGITWRY